MTKNDEKSAKTAILNLPTTNSCLVLFEQLFGGCLVGVWCCLFDQTPLILLLVFRAQILCRIF